MFKDCGFLESINFGTDFATSNVEDMESMFESCISLTSLDVSKFKTGKVESMAYMFINSA